MKMFWVYIALVAVISVADLFFFRWALGVHDLGRPLLLSFSMAVFFFLIIFIIENDKKGSVVVGFSIIAFWASLLVQVGREVPMPILLDGAILFFFPLLLIESRAGNMRFVPVLLSGLAESILIFGLIQGIILVDGANFNPMQFTVFFR